MLAERRVLIIDDERRMADSLQSLFEAEGYHADVAYGGREGIAKAGEGDYHVVVTDIKMDDADGYAVMRFVKENCPKSLSIAITGYASTESAIKAIRESAFDYIPKPYEFDQLHDAVRRAFEQIETLQMREDLISMITHDIKVPLGTIIGYAQMALEGEGEELHPRAREFIELISISGERILSLVDNFLTTCRVDAGRLEIVEIPVALLETLEDLQPIAELEARKRGVELSVNLTWDSLFISGDPNLIFRALGNLFHNAIKYAGQGGSVEVSLGRIERPAEGGEPRPWALFEIGNTGAGIAVEDLPHVFDRYVRPGDSGGAEGLGLGLYVVKCIVEAHHGEITVDSRPGEQTVFRVYLPAIEAQPVQPSEEPSE